MTARPFGLVALDGADDDGGTLYVLLDAGQPVLGAAWPQPLEAHAAAAGRPCVRVTRPDDYGPDDYDDERELVADLMARVREEVS